MKAETMEKVLTQETLKSDFIDKIAQESDQNVYLCYQCRKCAAGCPVTYETDYTPFQIIQGVIYGQRELVLNSKMIWLCTTCETCTTRCPQEIDIARVMDAARIIAQREGIKAKYPVVPAFFQTSLQNISWFGRLYEVGLIMMLKLRTKDFTKDVGLGIKMFLRRKLKLTPKPTALREVRRIFKKIKEIEETG